MIMYFMPLSFGNTIDKKTSRVYVSSYQEFIIYITPYIYYELLLLWIFETRIAIMTITNQRQHHDCEEDMIIINIISQPYYVYIH